MSYLSSDKNKNTSIGVSEKVTEISITDDRDGRSNVHAHTTKRILCCKHTIDGLRQNGSVISEGAFLNVTIVKSFLLRVNKRYCKGSSDRAGRSVQCLWSAVVSL